MDVDRRKSSSYKSLFGTSTLAGFNVVVYQDTLVGALYRSSGFELFLEGFRVSGHRREKPKIIIRLNIDGSTVRAVGATARFFNPMAIKPATVLDSFRKRKAKQNLI